MRRRKVCEPKLNKNGKKTKGGYYLNKNGVPLDRFGGNVMKTMKYYH